MNSQPPLWTCPKCGKKFVSKNLWHSCVRIPLESHFEGKDPELKKLFNAYLKLVKSCGPIIVNVSRTRIEFQARMRFAGVPRIGKTSLTGGFVLVREISSPRFSKVEFIPPRYWTYFFPIRSLADLDDELHGWIAEAYQVGIQNHITKHKKFSDA
jgi:hypothetical protein